MRQNFMGNQPPRGPAGPPPRPQYNECPPPHQAGRVRQPLLPNYSQGGPPNQERFFRPPIPPHHEPRPPLLNNHPHQPRFSNNSSNQSFQPLNSGPSFRQPTPAPPSPVRSGGPGGLLPTPPTPRVNSQRPLNPNASPFRPNSSPGGSPMKRKGDFTPAQQPNKAIRLSGAQGGGNGFQGANRKPIIMSKPVPTVKQIQTVDLSSHLKAQPANNSNNGRTIVQLKRATNSEDACKAKTGSGIEVDKDYLKKMEEQKRKREEILRQKEARRKEMVQRKATVQ